MSIVPVGTTWTLMVLHQGRGQSRTLTIQVSEVRGQSIYLVILTTSYPF